MSERSHDIEKYLRGELTPAEMHALEKQALDDPFLADALEGASELKHHELSADLQSLRKALNERVEEKKVVPMWIWTARIAAGLVLIAVSAFIIINLTEDSKKKDLAMLEQQQADSTSNNSSPGEQAAASDAGPKASTQDDLLAQNADDDNENKPDQVIPSKRDSFKSKLAEPASKPVIQGDLASRSSQPATDSLKVAEWTDSELAELSPTEAEKADGYIDSKKIAKEETRSRAKVFETAPATSAEGVLAKPVSPTPSPSAGYNYSVTDSRRDSSSTVALTKVTGRVTSAEDGTGLPGVNVVIKGTSTGTVTDIQGNYQIEISDPYATLVYSFIGLESTEIPVNNTREVDAVMQQDVAQLSEVVVTGFGEAENRPSYPTFEMAEPFGGRRAFKKYLEDKLIYPQQAIANKIEGKVTIQFTVESTGKLTNFNVIKGIGYGCDEEVIRLIKQGPKWSASKRNDEHVKGKVRVRMRFSLPKKK